MGEGGFEGDVFGVGDQEGRVADDGAEEFLFGDLFKVGEVEFGEEVLWDQWCKRGGDILVGWGSYFVVQ